MTYSVVVVDDQREFRPVKLRAQQDIKYFPFSTGALDYMWPLEDDRPPIDELWLDFDLGGTDTTEQIYLSLERDALAGNPYPVRWILIHSMNIAARPPMYQALWRHYPTTVVYSPMQHGLVCVTNDFEG